MFRFKKFSVINEGAALKVGTDAVLLGVIMTLENADRTLLDIGTGSGVISLIAAQRLSCMGADNFRISGIDIDKASADEASENFSASPWADNLTAANVPLQDFSAENGFDCIFSNPPYYDVSLVNPDARKSAARHSVSLSLDDILSFASGHLNAGGRLSLILPATAERDLFRRAGGWGLFPSRVVRIRTTERKAPGRIVAEFGRIRAVATAEEELTMMKEGKHTERYASLVNDFYLSEN